MNPLFPELVPFDAVQGDSKSAHEALYARLRSHSSAMNRPQDFPVAEIINCAKLENLHSSSSAELLRYYAWLGSACMTTAFIMTQRNAALKRLEVSCNARHRDQWGSRVRNGEWFATVGISHLSTSRQHLSVPPLLATETTDGWHLSGFTPWVTGASQADVLVVGAMAATGGFRSSSDVTNHSSEVSQCATLEPAVAAVIYEPVMLAIEANRYGISVSPGMDLMALTASSTDKVAFHEVQFTADDWVQPPSSILPRAVSASSSAPSGAGGLQTSALAIGLSAAAIEYLHLQSRVRPELVSPTDGFIAQWKQLFQMLTSADSAVAPTLRKNANDLVLQSTQAALAAAKGAGYVHGHDVGRWCREALFFLVWSCPQTVIDAHLCSFSQYDNPTSI